ncbi:UV-stimulated scaffold protein A [Elysia marginata]|uniref:UV-stimulated scaffold protein A n=1 Tax=Elysia marginata TaxID=1093978 RepID=A0AAV4J3W2_9GAST|nr:UV-stimulated scaffold protein A [Elysia marginata]
MFKLDFNIKTPYRDSEDNVRHAFYLIMNQLTKNHSEIRLSASQMADELFNRSHAFREILVNHLNGFLALTTEMEASKPLPPPKSAAVKMKADTLQAIQQWHDKYGQGYRKLVVGYEYLKNCKHIDFNDIRARSLAEKKRVEEQERKKKEMMAKKLAKVLKEISEEQAEIKVNIKEAESCLQLLLPTPDDFLQNLPREDYLSSQSVSEAVLSETYSEKTADGAALSGSQLIESHTDFDPPKDMESNSSGCEKGNKGDVEVKHNGADERNGLDSDAMCTDEEEDEDMEDRQLHGLPGPDRSIEINLGQPDTVAIQETADNEDVVQTLKESSKVINENCLPKVIHWLEILSKNGAKDDDIKAAIDLKVQLESVKQKCVELKLVSVEKRKLEDMDSDEEDFEDVPEKEGYEPRIPTHLRKEYGLDESEPSVKSKPGSCSKQSGGPSSSTSQLSAKAKPESSAKKSGGPSSLSSPSSSSSSKSQVCIPSQPKKSRQWSLTESLKKEYVADPTSLAAAMARVNPESLKDEASSVSKASSKHCDGNPKVPFVRFDVDLEYWDKPDQMEAPSVVKYDSLHRFWTPNEHESEKPSEHALSALKTRVVTFVGKFEPVKWKCRAPMPNGTLCERMDRHKCPFHGKVIARDEQGKPQVDVGAPSSSESSKTTEKESSSTEVNEVIPPWKDPELQREIEEATGVDLGSARSQKELDKKHGKGKGKGKGKKTSNLTDINASKNTVRKRIETRIFNKGAMRRVCATLDSADYRRVRDKFANQFNYSLK